MSASVSRGLTRRSHPSIASSSRQAIATRPNGGPIGKRWPTACSPSVPWPTASIVMRCVWPIFDIEQPAPSVVCRKLSVSRPRSNSGNCTLKPGTTPNNPLPSGERRPSRRVTQLPRSSSASTSAQVDVLIPQLLASSADVRPSGESDSDASTSITRPVGGDLTGPVVLGGAVDESMATFLASVLNLLHRFLILGETMYKVGVWGPGSMGLIALRGVIDHPQLQLVDLVVHSDAKAGRDAGELCGADPVGVTATQDPAELLSGDADVVVYAAAANLRPAEAIDDMVSILRAGKNVVSCSVVPLVYPDGVDAGFTAPPPR